MADKTFKGKMWKVVDGFVLFYNIPNSLGVPAVRSSTRALTVDNELEAVDFVMVGHTTQCPYCDRKTCFEKPYLLDTRELLCDDFDFTKVYATCVCQTTGKKFVVQRHLNMGDVLKHCLFCNSKKMIKDESRMPKFCTVQCRQCAQEYMLRVKAKPEELKDDRLTVSHIEYYGLFKYARRPFDNMFLDVLGANFRKELFIEDKKDAVGKDKDLILACREAIKDREFISRFVVHCVPSKKQEKTRTVILKLKKS